MKDITVIGIDIAKNYIQIHGANMQGKKMLAKRLRREQFLTEMANIPPCIIGMEACGGAHHWANELIKLGHHVKLLNPKIVKQFATHHKNDARDAEACAEAVSRANMRFVPIKSKAQMDIQALHRFRSFYLKQRTGLMNTIRGILLESGIAIPQGETPLVKKLVTLIAEPTSPNHEILQALYDDLKNLNTRIRSQTNRLKAMAKEDPCCVRMSTLPGIGPITATALVAKIGNGSEFKKGRGLSAYLGLVPKQHSSGEKRVLLGISKHGDRYIRQLLIHGGRAVVQAALRKNKLTGAFEKQDKHSVWIRKLADRAGMNKTSVAVANKNARIIIALLKNETEFQAALAHAE